jgi:hypothetical protein
MTKINELIRDNEEKLESLSSDAVTTLEVISNLTVSVSGFKSRWFTAIQKNQETKASLLGQINEAQTILDNYSQIALDNFTQFQEKFSQVDVQTETVMNHWQNQFLIMEQAQTVIEQTFKAQVNYCEEQINLSAQKRENLKENVNEQKNQILASLQVLYQLGETLQKQLNEKQEQHDNSYQELIRNLSISIENSLEDFQPLVVGTRREVDDLTSYLDDLKDDLEDLLFEQSNEQIFQETSQTLEAFQENINYLQEKSDNGFQTLEKYFIEGEEQIQFISETIKQISQTLTQCRDELNPIL